MTRACRLLCLHDTQNLPDVDIYFTSDTRIAEILNLGLGEEFSKIYKSRCEWLATMKRGKYSSAFALACEMKRTRHGEKIYCRWYLRYIVDNVFYFLFILFYFFFFTRELKNRVQEFYGKFFAPLFSSHRSMSKGFIGSIYIYAYTLTWSSYVTESSRYDTHDTCNTWRLLFLIIAVAWSITDRWQRGKNLLFYFRGILAQ